MNIDLDTLRSEFHPGLTASVGGSLAEAATVCLDHVNHAPPADLRLSGAAVPRAVVVWQPPDEQTRAAHFDLQDATEDGACGIAILLALSLLKKHVVRRAYKGRTRDFGFDYWLGDADGSPPFLTDTRLEVSGILNGTPAELSRRFQTKVDQVRRSGSDYPGLAIVVMFSTPEAQIGL